MYIKYYDMKIKIICNICYDMRIKIYVLYIHICTYVLDTSSLLDLQLQAFDPSL